MGWSGSAERPGFGVAPELLHVRLCKVLEALSQLWYIIECPVEPLFSRQCPRSALIWPVICNHYSERSDQFEPIVEDVVGTHFKFPTPSGIPVKVWLKVWLIYC